jgi:hypothetical protein
VKTARLSAPQNALVETGLYTYFTVYARLLQKIIVRGQRGVK